MDVLYRAGETHQVGALTACPKRCIFVSDSMHYLVISLAGSLGSLSSSDYSKVQCHPQSLYELHGSWTDFDKFDNYGTAREVVSECSHIEEMNERLRFFVEECDHIQVLSFPNILLVNTLFTVILRAMFTYAISDLCR